MIISTIFLLLSLLKRDHKSTSLVWKIVKIQFIKWHFFIVCTYFRRYNTMDLEMSRLSVSHQNGDHNQEFTTSYINVINSELWPSFWWMTFQRIVSNFIVLRRLDWWYILLGNVKSFAKLDYLKHVFILVWSSRSVSDHKFNSTEQQAGLSQ